jgi:hypothetical protein
VDYRTRTVVLSVIILLLGLSTFAQSTQKLVFWNGNSACGYKSKTFKPEDQIACSTVATERGPVSVISLNGVSLSAAFLEDGPFHIVAAHIQNPTGEVVMFDPDDWGAAHFKTRSGYYKGEKPLLAETAIPSRDIIRQMAYGTNLGNSLDKFIAKDQKKIETRELRRPDGTRVYRQVMVPDVEAQETAHDRAQVRAELTMEQQQRIRSTALTAKSVQPASSTRGLVYFRRLKEADFVAFSLRVGDATFVFLLPRKEKDQ